MADYEIELPQNYSGEDSNTKLTSALKKIWDPQIPLRVKNVKSFDLLVAILNKHKKVVGPYHMWEEKLFFRAKATLPIEPLIRVGYIEGSDEKIYVDQFKAAFGEVDQKIRNQMISLSKYVGLDLSQFDLQGHVTYFFD